MGAESPRRIPQEGADFSDLLPKPKQQRDEKGEIIPFIRPLNRQKLMDAISVRMQANPNMKFGEAFDEAFRTNDWKQGLVDEELGAYAQVVHDAYNVPYRPQDDWFKKIAAKIPGERMQMDIDSGDLPPSEM